MLKVISRAMVSIKETHPMEASGNCIAMFCAKDKKGNLEDRAS